MDCLPPATLFFYQILPMTHHPGGSPDQSPEGGERDPLQGEGSKLNTVLLGIHRILLFHPDQEPDYGEVLRTLTGLQEGALAWLTRLHPDTGEVMRFLFAASDPGLLDGLSGLTAEEADFIRGPGPNSEGDLSRQVIITNDSSLNSSGPFWPFLHFPSEIGSFGTFPCLHENRMVGVLGFGSSRTSCLDGETRLFLQEVAQSLALCLHTRTPAGRSSSESAFVRMTDFYRALHAINRLINQNLSERELLDGVCHIVHAHTQLPLAAIVVPSKEGTLISMAPAGPHELGPFLQSSLFSQSPQEGPHALPDQNGIVVLDDLPGVLGNLGLPEWQEVALSYGLRSCAKFPIQQEGNPYGALFVFSKKPDEFSQDLQELLSETASILSNAIDRNIHEEKRLEAERNLLRKTQFYNALYQLNLLISKRPDRETLFAESCRIFVQYGSLMKVIIWIYDTEKETLIPSAAFFTPKTGSHSIPEPNTVILVPPEAKNLLHPLYETFFTFKPSIIPDLQSFFAQSGQSNLLEMDQTFQCRSLANMALVLNGVPYGCISACSDDPLSFDQEFLDLLAEAARNISFALDNIERDLTRQKTESALRESEEKYRLLMEEAEDGILIVDKDGRITELNRQAERLLGRPSPLLTGSRLRQVLPKDPEKDREDWSTRLHPSPIHRRLTDLHGNPVDVEVSETPFNYQGQTYTQVRMRDVTSFRMYEDKIRYLADHDSLTGLANRRHFNLRLEHETRQARKDQEQVGLLYIDLDRFKSINDNLGHKVGDLLLETVALRLHNAVRTSDLVGRIGGDEFLILLPKIRDLSRVTSLAEIILKKLSEPFHLNNHVLHLSASIGISIFPDDADTVEILIQNADAAMYQAKKDGCNRFAYFQSFMNSHVQKRFALEYEIRSALKNGQFEVYYQPQVDMGRKQVVGLEALLRWNHPERGLIFPGQFIALAEDTSLINPIGRWVIQSVLNQLKLWSEEEYPGLRISVNLSSVQINQDKGFWEYTLDALQRLNVSPASIEFEITESVLLSNFERSDSLFRKMKELGIRLSLDDFGTGYSPFQNLVHFPIDAIKIDISFIQDMLSDHRKDVIVNAIISLAARSGLETIAEGVSDDNQLRALLRHGCQTIQGALFSMPVPAVQVPAVIQKIQEQLQKMDLSNYAGPDP
ncbi:MAG: bifunctional diguanylate cyclase/phosphodiesterase [Leptospirales bacterium]